MCVGDSHGKLTEALVNGVASHFTQLDTNKDGKLNKVGCYLHLSLGLNFGALSFKSCVFNTSFYLGKAPLQVTYVQGSDSTNKSARSSMHVHPENEKH